MSDPRVESDLLKIGSADIYNYIISIEANESDVFDRQRLKMTAVKIPKKNKHLKRNDLIKNHYKSCHQLFNQIK